MLVLIKRTAKELRRLRDFVPRLSTDVLPLGPIGHFCPQNSRFSTPYMQLIGIGTVLVSHFCL